MNGVIIEKLTSGAKQISYVLVKFTDYKLKCVSSAHLLNLKVCRIISLSAKYL